MYYSSIKIVYSVDHIIFVFRLGVFLLSLFQDSFYFCLDAFSDIYCVLLVFCLFYALGTLRINHTCHLQAILESDPFSITLKDITKAKKLGEDFAKEIGCKDIACLYTKVIHCLLLLFHIQWNHSLQSSS